MGGPQGLGEGGFTESETIAGCSWGLSRETPRAVEDDRGTSFGKTPGHCQPSEASPEASTAPAPASPSESPSPRCERGVRPDRMDEMCKACLELVGEFEEVKKLVEINCSLSSEINTGVTSGG